MGMFRKKDSKKARSSQQQAQRANAKQIAPQKAFCRVCGTRRDFSKCWVRVNPLQKCPGCGTTLIKRQGFMVQKNRLKDGACPDCQREIPGRWG